MQLEHTRQVIKRDIKKEAGAEAWNGDERRFHAFASNT